jgi:hypothetical protein
MSTPTISPALPTFPTEVELRIKIKVQTPEALELLTSLDPVTSFKTDITGFLEEEYGLELVEYKT